MGTKFAIAAAVAASFLGSAAAYAAPNLIQNGDFSSSTYATNSQFGTGFGGQGVTGWTGGTGYQLYFTSASASSTVSAVSQYNTGKEKLYGPVASSPGGGAFVGLDGEQSAGVQGTLSQTVTGLTVGKSYTLTFDWASGQLQSRSGATTEQLEVTFGSAAAQFTPVVSNVSGGFTGWASESFTFVANSTSDLLTFISVGTPAGFPPIALLDDVSLVQQVTGADVSGSVGRWRVRSRHGSP